MSKTESLTKHRLINNKALDFSYRFFGLNKRFAAVHNMIAGDISIDEDMIILIGKIYYISFVMNITAK